MPVADRYLPSRAAALKLCRKSRAAGALLRRERWWSGNLSSAFQPVSAAPVNFLLPSFVLFVSHQVAHPAGWIFMRLVVDNLSKEYRGKVHALRSVELTLEAGVLGLLGPNGAGKSTLMRILATITQPSSGRVLWNETEIARDPDDGCVIVARIRISVDFPAPLGPSK